MFKHCGIFLIYIIILIYILTGCELGIDNDEMDKIKIIKNCEVTESEGTLNDLKRNGDNNNKQLTTTLNIDLLKKIEKQLNSENKINDSSSILKNSSMNKTDILKLNKSINYIHSICEEFAGVYIIMFCIFTTLIIYYGKKKTDYIQQYDGKWRYKSPLNSINVVVNLLQFILIIYLIVKVIKVWNFIYIFSSLKYIGYSSIIWITTGPLVNVYDIIIYYLIYFKEILIVILTRILYCINKS